LKGQGLVIYPIAKNSDEQLPKDLKKYFHCTEMTPLQSALCLRMFPKAEKLDLRV
jgi:hypothetical protein